MIGAGKPDSRHEHELASPDQNQTSLYVILGTAQVEFGPAGLRSLNVARATSSMSRVALYTPSRIPAAPKRPQ